MLDMTSVIVNYTF